MPFHVVNQVGDFVDCISFVKKSNIMGGSRKVHQRGFSKVFLSPTYFTEGHTNLPREAIGPPPIASRARSVQVFKLSIAAYKCFSERPTPPPGSAHEYLAGNVCGLYVSTSFFSSTEKNTRGRGHSISK